MNRLLSTLFFTVLSVAATPSLSTSQALDAKSNGRIEFQSYTPKTMFDLAKELRQNWRDQTVWGELSFPSNMSDKVPAMVLSHGSGGVERSIYQWVEALNDIGVATFVVDSFGPRGVKSTVEDQSLVPFSANLVDALQALNLLATHPRIDEKKIGIIGFSRGGEVAFRTAIQTFLRAVVKSDLKFAVHIPVYASCNNVIWSENLTKVPMLNLLGAEDDYTHAAPCEVLAQKYAAVGVPIRSISYQNAHHAWDSLYPVMSVPGATSAFNCGVVRWDIESWKITSERTGELIGPSNLKTFFNLCITRGVHVGRNETAFRQSRKDVQEFLRSVFFADK
jgi:dienelactone hydrolase